MFGYSSCLTLLLSPVPSASCGVLLDCLALKEQALKIFAQPEDSSSLSLTVFDHLLGKLLEAAQILPNFESDPSLVHASTKDVADLLSSFSLVGFDQSPLARDVLRLSIAVFYGSPPPPNSQLFISLQEAIQKYVWITPNLDHLSEQNMGHFLSLYLVRVLLQLNTSVSLFPESASPFSPGLNQ